MTRIKELQLETGQGVAGSSGDSLPPNCHC